MNNKRFWLTTSLAALLAGGLATTIAKANPQDFVGTWVNTDSDTGGVTRLVITSVAGSDDLMIQVFGRCHPSDCDWGSTDLVTYGSSVQDPDHTQGTAQYQKGYANTLLTLQLRGMARDRINLQSFTEFTDSSHRENYALQEQFERRQTAVLQEDCVGFNPATTTVSQINGRWKIVDGSHWLFDFGSNESEAQQALSVIQHYGMNQSCFVGRPGPSFKYLLVNEAAPMGAMPDEDCVSFNPETSVVSQINGRWKIVDGHHWVFDFDHQEDEARQSLDIIQAHGFNQSCFVGRPDPSFTYLRQ
jgi:hypothetical protein